MKYKILIDSISNFNSTELNNENVVVESIPLILRVDGVDYIDDGKTNTDEIIDRMTEDKKNSIPASTACPSPKDYFDRYEGADRYFVITVSQKVSGSYNSANVAKNMLDHPEHVCLIDSQTACGAQELIARKIVEGINEGKSFEELCEIGEKAKSEVNILFYLGGFNTLIRMGRVSKLVGSIASILKIKPLGIAKEGEIRILEKIRLFGSYEARLFANIEKFCPDSTGRTCIINYTGADDTNAKKLREVMLERFNFANIIIRKNMAVSSFYSLTGTLMISF
jgi:putative degV family protein